MTCTYTRYTHSLTGFYTARLPEDQASIRLKIECLSADPKLRSVFLFRSRLPWSRAGAARGEPARRCLPDRRRTDGKQSGGLLTVCRCFSRDESRRSDEIRAQDDVSGAPPYAEILQRTVVRRRHRRRFRMSGKQRNTCPSHPPRCTCRHFARIESRH